MIGTYIFTCSAGRCGTAYVARLFDAQHEPHPKLMQVGNAGLSDMIRDVAGNGNYQRAREYLERIKLPSINQGCSGDVYMETAHTFSKGFLLPLIDMLDAKLKIIRLRRDKQAIVNSLLRLGTIPPAGGWYLSGADEICVGRMAARTWSAMTDREKCCWYVDEIERQWEFRIVPKLKKEQRFEVNLDDILCYGNTLLELEAFAGLNIVRERIGLLVNEKK